MRLPLWALTIRSDRIIYVRITSVYVLALISQSVRRRPLQSVTFKWQRDWATINIKDDVVRLDSGHLV